VSATLYRRWFDEVWNQGRVATIDELVAPDAVIRGLGDSLRGPEGFRAFRAGFVQTFPTVQVEVHDVVESPPASDGTLTVAGRFTAHVVTDHGQRVPMACMNFTRWRGGRLVESWDVCDFRALEKAAGALPF
jgi:predicted ester cyclase